MRLGKYELGRTLGEGNFGKVKFAQNVDSGLPFAVKILEKNRIIHLKITDQVFTFILFFDCFLSPPLPFFFFFLKKRKKEKKNNSFNSLLILMPACLQKMIIIAIDFAFFFIWVSFLFTIHMGFFPVNFGCLQACNLTLLLLNLDSFIIL